MLMMDVAQDSAIIEKFEDLVKSPEFPCVGAKSALNKAQMHFVIADDICSAWDDLRILPPAITASIRNCFKRWSSFSAGPSC
jgi:uncharacterized protein